MNYTDLTPEEGAMVLDGLAALPLARSYNLFNKLYQQNAAQNAPKPSVPPPATTQAVDA